MFFGGKKVKTCDFGQKKPRISAKTFFFYGDPSDFGENLCPPDLNFAPPPPFSRGWRRPCSYPFYAASLIMFSTANSYATF